MFFGFRMGNFIQSLIIVNAFMFFVSMAAQESTYRYLALTPAHVFAMPWTLVTSMFLHAGLEHLILNVLFGIMMFGSLLQSIVGERELIRVYLVGGVFASLSYVFTSLLFNIPPPFVPAVGASGAIFAVMGMLVVLRPKQTIYFNLIIPMPMYVWALLYALYSLAMMFGTMGTVAHNAHLGGLIFGLLYGYYYKKKRVSEYTYGVTYRYV